MADNVPNHRIVPSNIQDRAVHPYTRVIYSHQPTPTNPPSPPASLTTEETRSMFFPSLVLLVITFGGLYLIRRNYLREEWGHRLAHSPGAAFDGVTSMTEQPKPRQSSTPLKN